MSSLSNLLGDLYDDEQQPNPPPVPSDEGDSGDDADVATMVDRMLSQMGPQRAPAPVAGIAAAPTLPDEPELDDQPADDLLDGLDGGAIDDADELAGLLAAALTPEADTAPGDDFTAQIDEPVVSSSLGEVLRGLSSPAEVAQIAASLTPDPIDDAKPDPEPHSLAETDLVAALAPIDGDDPLVETGPDPIAETDAVDDMAETALDAADGLDALLAAGAPVDTVEPATPAGLMITPWAPGDDDILPARRRRQLVRLRR